LDEIILALNKGFYPIFSVNRFFFLLCWDLKNRVRILDLEILMGLWVFSS